MKVIVIVMKIVDEADIKIVILKVIIIAIDTFISKNRRDSP